MCSPCCSQGPPRVPPKCPIGFTDQTSQMKADGIKNDCPLPLSNSKNTLRANTQKPTSQHTSHQRNSAQQKSSQMKPYYKAHKPAAKNMKTCHRVAKCKRACH